MRCTRLPGKFHYFDGYVERKSMLATDCSEVVPIGDVRFVPTLCHQRAKISAALLRAKPVWNVPACFEGLVLKAAFW